MNVMNYSLPGVRTPSYYHQPIKRFRLSNCSLPIYETDIKALRQPSNNTNENDLLSLCKAEKWFEVYHRCHEFPHECNPVFDKVFNGFSTIYGETALGIACRNFDKNGKNGITSDQMFATIKALYFASSMQIRCSQRSLGLTPLMDALNNPKSSLELVQFLIEADLNLGDGSNSSLLQKDINGLSPFDHMITLVHREDQSGIIAVETIRYLVQKFALMNKSKFLINSCHGNSPLILLLSHRVKPLFSLSKTDEDKRLIQSRIRRVTDCVKILLQGYPTLIYSRSVMSNCTPLHMAFRNNYGNQLELIELLLSYDLEMSQINVRNRFGDLPIHIAVSNRVSPEVLQVLFQHVLLSASPQSESNETSAMYQVRKTRPCVWPNNKKGFTPIHLAWMCRVDGKPSYPNMRNNHIHNGSNLDTSGNSKYSDSLSQAVNKISSLIRKLPTAELISDREHIAKQVLGYFWDFLKVYLMAIHCLRENQFINNRAQKVGKNSFHFLHAVSSLPQDVFGSRISMNLFHIGLMVYPNEIKMKDENGKTALHYATASALFTETESKRSHSHNRLEESKKQPFGWHFPVSSKKSTTYSLSIPILEEIVEERMEQLLKSSSRVDVLIALYPDAALIYDKEMRLPLHYAIESEKKYDGNIQSKIKKEWNKNIRKLLVANPDALDKRDPYDHCYPFMQAAISTNSSLDTVYHILRMAPNLVRN